jgi:hypothetical protein
VGLSSTREIEPSHSVAPQPLTAITGPRWLIHKRIALAVLPNHTRPAERASRLHVTQALNAPACSYRPSPEGQLSHHQEKSCGGRSRGWSGRAGSRAIRAT